MSDIEEIKFALLSMLFIALPVPLLYFVSQLFLLRTGVVFFIMLLIVSFVLFKPLLNTLSAVLFTVFCSGLWSAALIPFLKPMLSRTLFTVIVLYPFIAMVTSVLLLAILMTKEMFGEEGGDSNDFKA